MKNIEIVLEALGEKIKNLETDCFLKDREIERLTAEKEEWKQSFDKADARIIELKKAAAIETRPSTKKAEETRK